MDPPEGVVINSTHLPTSESSPLVGLDLGPSALSTESILISMDDDDGLFEADYQSSQAHHKLFDCLVCPR
jgi:hypothetical protein